MSVITAADKRLRAASAVLEAGLQVDADRFAVDRDLARMAEEQQHVRAAVRSLLERMRRPELSAAELDRLTRTTTRLLAVAEDLREARAKTAARRAGAARTWRTRLALD